MEAATVPQVEKRLYRNNTAGFLGVVKLNHKGEEVGENIDPHGTVWLSDEEALLTARAPRRKEDNPFEEHTFTVFNQETQRHEDVQLRPLTLESDERFVPNERYVPTVAEAQANQADTAPLVERKAAVEETAPPAPVSSGSRTPQQVPPPAEAPVAPQSGPVPPVRSERRPVPAPAPETALAGLGAPVGGEQAASWTEPPEAPGQVIAGNLGGEDTPPPEIAAAAAPDTTDHPGERYAPTAGQAQAAPQTPGAEEHAARVDPEVGEETGAARPPTQPQPEGEYAQAEEVGSPDAPAQDEPLIGG